MGDRSPRPGPGRALSATMDDSELHPSFRTGAAVMRSTVDRFDAVLSDESLSEPEVLRRLALEAEQLYRAMGTLDRELEEIAE